MKAHFQLNRTVNKQNCHIYPTTRDSRKVPLHFVKVNIWIGVYTKTVIRAFFLKDKDIQTVTFNQECYLLVSTR